MKIISWNVNGIRAAVKKGFLDFLKKEKPDILCCQEIKIAAEARAKEQFDFPGYAEFWNSAQRPGYSGTLTLARSGSIASQTVEPLALPAYGWDDEGRVQIIDLGKFYLVNVYFPNANPELSRLDFKINFNDRLLREFKKLEKKKPLVVCGDYNVAHQEIDLARPKENVGNPGFTDEERAWMTKLLKSGFVDTFRAHNPAKIQYSWWSYRSFARTKNIGWRIDYFCVSKEFYPKVKNSFILDKIQGSDHAPVGIMVDV